VVLEIPARWLVFGILVGLIWLNFRPCSSANTARGLALYGTVRWISKSPETSTVKRTRGISALLPIRISRIWDSMSMALSTLGPPSTIRHSREPGKTARKRAPRHVHGKWEPSADRTDPIEILRAQAATREKDLVPIRYGRMVASAFAFFRGAPAIMASDLADTPTSGITVQACGDAHLVNFGLFSSPERELVFAVNDFDETLPGPWEWDVKRLAASVAVATQRGKTASLAASNMRRPLERCAAIGKR
jgi:Uncharacterized protein conserved in bacteria (DUF2252)